MATLLQFSKNIRSRSSNIRNARVSMIRRAVLTAVKVMASGTPVDKGVARSNYRVSIGNRTFSTIPAYSPGSHLGIDETANLRAVVTAARQKLSTLRPGQSVWITNNTEYLDELNNPPGHSSQSRGGFIEAGFAAARISVENTRLFTRASINGRTESEELF